MGYHDCGLTDVSRRFASPGDLRVAVETYNTLRGLVVRVVRGGRATKATGCRRFTSHDHVPPDPPAPPALVLSHELRFPISPEHVVADPFFLVVRASRTAALLKGQGAVVGACTHVRDEHSDCDPAPVIEAGNHCDPEQLR